MTSETCGAVVSLDNESIDLHVAWHERIDRLGGGDE